MKNCIEQTRCLASLAVFRELFNKQQDVYGVISEFLSNLITSLGKYQFNVTEITNILNSNYDFQIPEAVVKTALNRITYLSKEQNQYIVNIAKLPKLKETQITTLQTEINATNSEIINDLFEFIEKEKKVKLNDEDKEAVIHSFCAFILDNSNGEKYAEFISAFLINNKENKSFRDKINQIREGVILYTGLKYNNNISELGSWKNELTLYLDTEVLFHFAGYNGEMFHNLFLDFYNYVKEINSKSPKKLIKLKYFENVVAEVEGFFTKAKHILEGKEKLSPKGTAMNSIIEGCKELSDIEEKKSDFYTLLKTNGIQLEESNNYYTESNYEYNIIDSQTIETITAELEYDITEHLENLNIISIKRNKQTINNFDQIGYIFLTGNSKTIKVAWHELVKPEGSVPLATTLSFLTNKFWFKLNKGFGNGLFPKSFDIINKAQIYLASELSNTLGSKYDELQEKFNTGKLTEEQAKARIVHLRKNVKKPEEIEKNNTASILHTITEDSLDQFIKEQEHFKFEAQEKEKENIKLKKTLTNKEKELEEIEAEIINKEIKRLSVQIENKKELFLEKEGYSIILNKQKIPIERIARKSLFYFKLKIIIILLVLYSVVCFLVWKFDWNILEQITFILALLLSNILPYLYLVIFEKEVNPKKYFLNKKNEIFNNTYNDFSFDFKKLNQLEKDKTDLETEIKNLEEQLKKASTQQGV